MSKYIITTSSTCDLTKDYLKQNENPFASFNFYLNDEEHKDDFYEHITMNDFYSALETKNAKTSQPSPEEFINIWTPYLQEGYDIVHLELSRGISGAYNSSLSAKDIIQADYKDNNIYVVDTLCASAGLGLLVMIANQKKAEGLSAKELYDYLSEAAININSLVCCSDLTQLFKGGRLSQAKYRFGKLLNIVPLIVVNKEGALEPYKNVRGKSNAFKEMLKTTENNIENGLDYNGKILISHSNCYDDAKELMSMLQDKFKNADASEQNIFNIGTVIGSHTGKGTIALFYVGKGRDYN